MKKRMTSHGIILLKLILLMLKIWTNVISIHKPEEDEERPQQKQKQSPWNVRHPLSIPGYFPNSSPESTDSLHRFQVHLRKPHQVHPRRSVTADPRPGLAGAEGQLLGGSRFLCLLPPAEATKAASIISVFVFLRLL